MADKNDDLIIGVSTDTSTLARGLNRLVSDVDSATKKIQGKFESVGKGIDKSMSSALQRQINSTVGIGVQATKEWTGALANQGKEFDRLRAKFNPIFTAVTSYKASVTEIKNAHAIGAISTNEMTAAITRERQATLASIAAIKQRNAAISDTPVQKSGAGSFSTSNIAAQFQDIGVTAAMGMSPIQIALQQGTQLSAVFNDIKNQGKAIGPALATAFGSIISPVSLITIGLIAAGVAAGQFLYTFLQSGTKTAEQLEKEAALIQNVANKWEYALPALKAYADQRQRLADQGDIKDATAGAIDAQWMAAKEQVSNLTVALEDANSQIRDFGGNATEIQKTRDEFDKLSKGIKDNKGETADAIAIGVQLSNLYTQTQIPAIDALAKRFFALAGAISVANNEASKLTVEQKLQDASITVLPQLGTLSPVNSGGGKLLNEAELQERRANEAKSKYQEEQERLEKRRAKGLSSAERAAQRDANAYRDLVKSAEDRIQQMQLEAQLVGKTGVAQDALRMKLELLQEATDKGRSVSAEQRAEIEKLAETYGAAAEKVAALKLQQDLLFERQQMFRSPTEQRVHSQLQSAGISPDSEQGKMLAGQIRLNESLAEGRDLALDFASSFVSDLRNGVKATEALGNALGKLGDKLLDMALNEAINALFGNLAGAATGGSGGGGGLLAGIGKIFGFANGVNSAPGGLSIVGERGPELMNVPRGARITPNHRIDPPSMPRLSKAGGSSAVSVSYNPVNNFQGTSQEMNQFRQELARDRAEFESRTVMAIRKANKTNVKLK